MIYNNCKTVETTDDKTALESLQNNYDLLKQKYEDLRVQSEDIHDKSIKLMN